MSEESHQEVGSGPAAWTVVVVAGFVLLLILTLQRASDGNGGVRWPADGDGWALLAFSVVYSIVAEFWILNGVRIVRADQVAMVSLFGKPLVERGAGLLYAPAPWAIRVESALPVEETFPPATSPSSPDGRPLLITHGTSETPTSDPLDNRLTTSVRIVARYRITDLIRFSQTVGTIEQARGRLRDAVVTIAQAECGRQTVGATLRSLPKVNAAITNAVREAVADWGILLVEVVLQDIDLGGSITEAMRNASVSIINLETNRNNAQQKLFEGQVAANVHRAFHYAKAEGYKAIARELGVAEPVVLYQLDTLANMWRRNNADVNLYSGDLGEVFKMVTAFSKIVDASRDEPSPPQLPS